MSRCVTLVCHFLVFSVITWCDSTCATAVSSNTEYRVRRTHCSRKGRSAKAILSQNLVEFSTFSDSSLALALLLENIEDSANSFVSIALLASRRSLLFQAGTCSCLLRHFDPFSQRLRANCEFDMLASTVRYSATWQLGWPRSKKTGRPFPRIVKAIRRVSTKALAGAKSLGGFLYSAVNKAGKTVVEASAKIKKTVEENRLIAELNKEQEAFIASKQTEKGEAVAPWVGAPNEDALREECLSLSTDRRNFVRAPPPGVEFAWDFEAVQPMAQATLALDPNLEAMRFELVPKVISEENFWRNYFYRVSLLRQGYELNSMASQAESNPNQTLASTDSIDHTQVQMTTGQGTTGATTTSSNSALTDSPGHEFVSDTMRVSDTDLEEVREGMKKLGMQPPKVLSPGQREMGPGVVVRPRTYIAEITRV
ncbi:synapse-associated protein 1 isoform X4 [Odontomachus brunneus]|uniref:synapse-associated protein 1 isoform X4 n=1 Tax=Odontomachus brunneus TaxID=486640 RepID=UPI0013F229CB|nr:synapse-associated protein 1 isoform X4 [Odontomachus brunneus]